MLRHLIRKEFLQIRRNAFLPRLIVAFPVVIMCVMPWVMQMEVKNIRVDVVDNDRSTASQRLVHAIEQSRYFIFGGQKPSYRLALSEVEKGRSDVVLVIPKDYGRELVKGRLPQVLIAALGFGLFGMGCDITGITVSKIVTKWFKGKELASAMGVQVAMARLGTASALSLSPLIAQTWGLPSPIIVGTLLLLVGFAVFVGYCFADKHFDESGAENFTGPADNSEPFRWHDFTALLRNPGFWLIALLCVSYYSSIRPFMKFATDLLISRYHADPVSAGWLVSIIPYGSIVLTPVFGMLYDRIGRGATLMLIGSALLTAIHICFALPIEWSGSMAIVLMVVLGVAFSLVPSAMWPSVPKIIPLKELGTAYSIIYYIQNIGLMLVPMMVGDVLKSDTTAGVPDFTRTQWIFAAFGLAAVVIAFVLLFVDRKKHYGLEEANISNHA